MNAMQPVTMIGLGPMGQAMAASLLGAGHPVTVWNRTPGRADDLVAAGAVRADTPAEALSAADLVILSLTHYQAMYDILGASTGALAGKTLANLSSDTPEVTRAAADWAKGHGARFLTGGVMVPAVMIGTNASYVYYSGPREVVDEHEPTLRRIGAARWVGADPGLAQLYYQAQLTVFLTVLSGLLQGAALVGSAGVPAAEFLPEAFDTVTAIPAMAGDETAKQLDSGVYPGDLSTVLMMGATADHIVEASRAAGIDLTLPLAVQSHYDRAVAAGHGADSWTSLFEVIKP
jgi:3-hydroxyisobutyrate dehydrogenase-like beta-hydroxyacid dehydrogenase